MIVLNSNRSIAQEFMVVNKDGETLQVNVKESKEKSLKKGGFRMAYMYQDKSGNIGYDDVMMELGSSLERRVFIAIRDSNMVKTFVLNFNQTKMAKRLDTTPNTVSKVVRKLKKIGFIRKEGSLWVLNPNVFIPFGIKDNVVALAQEEWNDWLKSNH